MLDDRLEPVASDEARTEDDPDAAPLVGDRAQLFVVDVSPVLEGSEDAGVTDDRGLGSERACIEKASPVDVREID